MGKSRVAPLRSVTIPRLELNAAVVSVRVSSLLRKELNFDCDEEFFWTDSNVILGYINNELKRFLVFVAIRIKHIRDNSSPSQWHHVDTHDNPADSASRGLTVNQLIETSSWLWERLIRPTRSILQTLMHQSGQQLDDESLRTFLCEAMAIINSRPLTVDPLGDPSHPEPLTLNHLLTMKSKILLPPPGNFQREDLYSTKRWKRVQHLTNEFWTRWRREFLQGLQTRQKWTHHQRDSQVGDIVMLKDDDTPRNRWSLARVEEVNPSDDEHIREVKVVVGDTDIDNKGSRIKPLKTLDRPIHKLVLLPVET